MKGNTRESAREETPADVPEQQAVSGYEAEDARPGNDGSGEQAGRPAIIRKTLRSGRVVYVNPAEVKARQVRRTDAARRNGGFSETADDETSSPEGIRDAGRSESGRVDENSGKERSGRRPEAAEYGQRAETPERTGLRENYVRAGRETTDERAGSDRPRYPESTASPERHAAEIPRRTVRFEGRDNERKEETAENRPAAKVTKVFTPRRSPAGNRDGERRDLRERDGERRDLRERDGERRDLRERDGERRDLRERDGERRDLRERDGERRDLRERDGERRDFRERDGERRDLRERDGERSGRIRDGDRRGAPGRDGKRDIRGHDAKDRSPRRDKKMPAPAVVFEDTGEFVIPGSVIGALEEYEPDYGCVGDRGNIIAVISGRVGISRDDRKITVLPASGVPNVIRDGDIVIGVVTDLRESSARIEIAATEKSPDREIVNNGNAEVYISNVKNGFTKEISDEFAPTDIIRARVINSSKIGLSTVDDDLGVIKAYCTGCRTALELSGSVDPNGSVLKCPECGRTETRKAASTYGQGIDF